LPWTPPVALELPCPLKFPDEVKLEIDQIAYDKLGDDYEENQLDAHRHLNRGKLSAAIAILDNRIEVNIEDWNLAEELVACSDDLRDDLQSSNSAEDRRREDDANSRAARRQLTVEGAVERRSREAAIRSVSRKVSKADGPVSRRTLARAIAGRDRNLVTVDDIIDEAVNREHIARTDADEFIKGKKPL
jgi:hypothetical protein